MGNESATKGSGGGPVGSFIGCLLLIIVTAVIVFIFIVKPMLEERGYNMEAVSKFTEKIKVEVDDKVSAAKENIASAKEKIDDTSEKAQSQSTVIMDGPGQSAAEKLKNVQSDE